MNIINKYRIKSNKSKSNEIQTEKYQEYLTNSFPKITVNLINYQFSIKNSILDSDIQTSEIIKSLNQTKNNKVAGPDSITNEFLKNLPQNWILYLNLLFNKILKNQEISADWAIVYTTMLYKKDDKANPQNYRPIALINSITKIFTRIIYNRLYEWSEKENKIPETQGFREKRGTLNNIFTLNNVIQIHLNKEKFNINYHLIANTPIKYFN